MLNHPPILKVLFVCSGNGGAIVPFILDQKQHLEAKNVQIEIFAIKGKGIFGYLKNLPRLYKVIRNNSFDLIHSHFGLSGLFACLQFKLPVVITLHGSDVNDLQKRLYSKIAIFLARKIIVVSEKMRVDLKHNDTILIPCGVDLDLFKPIDKSLARKKLNRATDFQFDTSIKYILFSSSFSRDVKNPKLAIDAVKILGIGYDLIELKGFSREEVVLLMNAVDVVLMTSISEGSPQFIKEAMACNRPIVCTDVGDVKEILKETPGCFICKSEKSDVANKIKDALNFEVTEGRGKIGLRYHHDLVVDKILEVYNSIVKSD